METLQNKMIIQMFLDIGNLPHEKIKDFVEEQSQKFGQYDDAVVFYIPIRGKSRMEVIYVPPTMYSGNPAIINCKCKCCCESDCKIDVIDTKTAILND
jgi:hypothetical protein